jgi:magnesium transporter
MARTKAGRKKETEQSQERPLHMEELVWKGITWINIEEPTERETAYLAGRFSFHPLDLDDTLSRIQRSKLDEYPEYLFLVLNFPVYDKQLRVTRASQVSIFIGKDYLVTLHKGDLKPLVKFFRECQLDEEFREEAFSHGSGYIVYRIIDRLVDYCLPILNKIADNIEDTEDDIFARRTSFQAIEGISILRRALITFRRIVWPLRAVMGSVESRIRRFSDIDLSVYFGDTVDHIDKIWDGLDEYKEVIEGINDTFDSMASNRINEVLRVLTILATIGAVMTVIASFYGMNVILPGMSNSFSWVFLLVGMLLLGVGMLFYFRHKNWL